MQILALSAFGIAAPLFDLLASEPAFFVARGSTALDVLLLASLLPLIPAALLWALGCALTRVSAAAGVLYHYSVVGLLIAATALAPLLRSDLVGDGGALAVALCVAGAGVALLWRSEPARQLLAWAAAGAPIFAGLFLLDGGIRSAVFSAGPSEVASGITSTAAPVVLVVFDELATSSLQNAAGAIDAERYPAFAELAATSTWYPRASTVAHTTAFAVPAILTGRYPGEARKLPTRVDHPENLFRLLASSHQQNVHETVTALGAPGASERIATSERLSSLTADVGLLYLHIVLPGAFAEGLPPVSENWGDFWQHSDGDEPNHDEVAEASGWKTKGRKFRDFVEAIAPTVELAGPDGASLHFLHSNLPHGPWTYLPSGKRYRPTRSYGVLMNRWSSLPWWSEDAYRRHLLQLGFCDRLLGELLGELRRTGLLDRSLVIVTADHGVSLWPGNDRRDPTRHEHPEDILGIPLFVKWPGQTDARVDTRRAQTIDILPTIADALDAPLSWPADGCSLADERCAQRERLEIYVFGARGEGNRKLSFPASMLDRRDTLERKMRVFGSGKGDEALFNPLPYAHLVGTRVTELDRSSEPAGRIHLRTPYPVAAVGDSANLLPVRVVGSVEPAAPLEGDPLIALALRGGVEAVVPAPRTGPRQPRLLSALLPETAVGDGLDGLELFLVDETPTGPRLAPLRIEE